MTTELRPPLVTECGYTANKERVQAVTDAFGPQVLITFPGRDPRLSEPLTDHTHAVELGDRVVEKGTGIYPNWQRPPSNILEFGMALVGGRIRQ